MSDPDGIAVTITGADILGKFDELSRDINGLGKKIDRIPDQVDDHEARIRIIEKRMWWASGVGAFAGVLVGTIVPIVSRLI